MSNNDTAQNHDLPYEHGPEPAHVHVLPVSVYLQVFAALIALTGLTVAVSFAGLGAFAIAAALLVAMIKAGFVIGYFMHLKYDLRFYSFVFLSTLLFIGLFFGLTFADLTARDSINLEEGTFTKQNEARDLKKADQWRKDHARAAPRRREPPRRRAAMPPDVRRTTPAPGDAMPAPAMPAPAMPAR